MNTVKSKWCWLSTETKNGWRLKLCLGNKDFSLRGLVLKTPKDIETIVNGKNGKIIFVHLKDSKFKN